MSENTMVILIVIAASALGIAVIVFLVARGEKRRRGRLTAVADQIGARFERRPDYQFVQELRDTFWVFRHYRRRGVNNLIERPGAEANFRLFEYTYWRIGSRTPSTWSVLLVTSPRLQLPSFTMGNHGGPLRIRDNFAGEPVAFPVSEFCDAHEVHADDAAASTGAFSAKLQQFLADRPHYCMEGAGEHFVLYEPDRKVKPEQVRTMIDDATVILTEFRTE